MVVFVAANPIVLNVLVHRKSFFLFFFVKLLGGRITIVDHPLLCFLPSHYNTAMLVAVMLLLSFFV